ncbi:hypothetical protein ACLB2K_054387 [Fragaria x ananassa]
MLTTIHFTLLEIHIQASLFLMSLSKYQMVGNRNGVRPPMKLQGYLLGNPVTELHSYENSRIEFYHRITLISSELYAIMSILLPPTIALRSHAFDTYLSYSNDSDSETHGLLKVNGEIVISRLAKFQVVSATIGTGLVHIRSSHNRKFLRRRIEGNLWSGDIYLSPDADEPEEDQSKWSCTLFEPRLFSPGNHVQVRFIHVQTKRYATAMEEVRGGKRFFGLTEVHSSASWIFDVIDLESMVILPKHVAFKGHTGNYLKLVEDAKHRFISTDEGLPESWYEVDTDRHGRVGIMSREDKKHCFALKRTMHWEPIDLLTAPFTSIAASTHLRLEELVLSRRIYETSFDLANAVIYGETPIIMASASASNNTSADNTVELKFEYKESQSSTWSSSHSWMVGVSLTAEFKVPFIGGTEVTAETQFSGSYDWGTTITSETTLGTTYTATVPAYSSIIVSLLATKGTCDVSFSYYQRDVLYDGSTEIFRKDDGLFTGINTYKFHYVVTTTKQSSESTTRVERFPDPLIDPTVEENLPLPELCGSTTTLELELSLLHVEEKTIQDAATLPLETNQEVGESLAW